MLQSLRNNLKNNLRSTLKSTLYNTLRPQRIPFRHMAQRSAVAIISRHGPKGEEILFIKRAARSGDPWSGHIAFPGGKKQTSDTSTQHTAIRETHEEINLDLAANSHYLGRSLDLITRRHNVVKPMIVTPYRFKLTSTNHFEASNIIPNNEVAEALWVPLAFLKDKNNQSTMRWSPFITSKKHPSYQTWLRSSATLQLPCYYFQGHCIWGLTYRMIIDIL